MEKNRDIFNILGVVGYKSFNLKIRPKFPAFLQDLNFSKKGSKNAEMWVTLPLHVSNDSWGMDSKFTFR